MDILIGIISIIWMLLVVIGIYKIARIQEQCRDYLQQIASQTRKNPPKIDGSRLTVME